MDTKYLSYILAIAHHKNMTKASEELFVSQSSLSQYLSKLEQELGTPLFYRAKGELSLTPAGQLYTNAALQIIDIKKQLYRDIQMLDQKGHITIGVTSQFGFRALAKIIPDYKTIYPNVSIEITEGNLLQITKLIQAGQLDLGIIASTEISPFEKNHTMLRKEQVLFAIPSTHLYCRKNTGSTIPVSDFVPMFENDNFLLCKKNSSIRMLTDVLFARLQFEPNTVCEINNITAIQDIVSHGAGVAFIAESCIQPDHTIHYYALEPGLSRYNLLVYRKNWILNTAETEFCSRIQSYFTEAPSFSEQDTKEDS